MYFGFLALAVVGFFMAFIGDESARGRDILPTSRTLQANLDADMFVSYRNAVALYLKNNPTHTGVVSTSVLNAQGTVFPAAFLANAGNEITATGINGRIITCYAMLPGGSMAVIVKATENDASFGFASGTNWTSIAPAATPVPLAITVPNGAVVSVNQVGT